MKQNGHARYEPATDSEARAWGEHVEPWLRRMVLRVHENLDCLVAVTGEEGSGKSTLALRLALRLDPNLGLEQIHNDTDNFRRAAGTSPEGSVLVLDEAFEGALNRQHASKRNVAFIKWLGEARALKHFMFICFPRFQNLDPYLRRHRVAFRVHVPERGEAEVYETQPDKFGRGESWQSLITKFTFGPLTNHPIWEAYQAQKVERIRARTEDLGRNVNPSGLTRRTLRKLGDAGMVPRDEVVKDMVANGHVGNLDHAALEMAAYTGEPPHNWHPYKNHDDTISLNGTPEPTTQTA